MNTQNCFPSYARSKRMRRRNGAWMDRLVSFFELSNTIPEAKRRVFISSLIIGILILGVNAIVTPIIDMDWFELAASIVMILVLTALTWLLWRRRERQELILFFVF